MYLRHTRALGTKEFACKYSRKRGWFKCKRVYKICYLQTSMKVRVLYNSEDHFHEKDDTYLTENKYYYAGLG